MSLLLLLGNHDDADTALTPDFSVDIAFTTNPGDTPSWTDVTDYVRSISISRGRHHELDRMEAGTCTVRLDNTDRRFEPEYASGAYYPNVLPMRRLRVRGAWSNIFDLFQGFIEGWPLSYVIAGPGGGDAVADVTAVDGFKVLALKRLTESYSSELSSVRAGNVLDDAAWPAADRSISTGQSLLQSSTVDDTPALSHLDAVMQTENGRHFIRGDGVYVFLDRFTPQESPYDTSQATFGDGGGSEIPYADLKLSYDDSQIWNEVQVTRTGGSTMTATDSTSQTTYLKRTLSRTGQLAASDAESWDAANWLLNRYKDPYLRVIEMTIPMNLAYRLTAYKQMLGREIGDRITVKRTPPGGGAAISQELWIEGIEHTVTPGLSWDTKWYLSRVYANEDYWILGTSTLGVDTVLGYGTTA